MHFNNNFWEKSAEVSGTPGGHSFVNVLLLGYLRLARAKFEPDSR